MQSENASFFSPYFENPFRSFWMAGFECSDQLNAFGNRVDFLEMTAHLDLIHEDYVRVSTLNIKSVREGIRWSVVEPRPYQYNFDQVTDMIRAGRQNGIQQIWDVCHFGYPDDLSPFHPHFVSRFVALCEAFVAFLSKHCPDEPILITPINEVSFISWLGGEVGGTTPYCLRNGWELKYALMKAYVAAAKAMKQISSLVRIVTTEPLVNMVTDLEPTEDDIERALHENELQFQAVDMLYGRICPELGGSPDLVDFVGFNYYYNNQWIVGKYEFLGWNDPVPDPRWRALSDMLTAGYRRYNKPIILSETSHPKEDRPIWIRMIARECEKVLQKNIPLFGVCLYPIIDRPDWDHPHIWHHSGIWDTDFSDKTSRVLHYPSRQALLWAQELLSRQLVKNKSKKLNDREMIS